MFWTPFAAWRHVVGNPLEPTTYWPRQEGTSAFIEELVLLSLRANPYPKQLIFCCLHCQGAMPQPHPHRPEPADAFEVKRRVAGVGFELLVGPVSELLHSDGKSFVGGPEARTGAMLHRSVQRPAARSPRASSASQSSRPVPRSCSTCRSHSRASKASNQARNCARCSGASCSTAAYMS